jgi:hypothetical protein
MTRARVLLPSLILAAALAAPALAQDAPVATASASAAPMTTAEQIDNYLKASPALQLPPQGAAGVTSSEEPRKVHGEVEVAVGTGGYRSAYARADMPVGKNGVVSLAVQQTEFKGRGGGQRGYQNLGLGFAFGDAAAGAGDTRCRRGPDGELIGRPMSRFGGGRAQELDGYGRQVCRAAPSPASD